jgi:hypothetical protein
MSFGEGTDVSFGTELLEVTGKFVSEETVFKAAYGTFTTTK